jgi:hypothetical protein
MKSFKDLYNEIYQKTPLNDYGYKGPFKGADNHISYIRGDKEILIDLPGNEWHFMLDGVVNSVGPLDDSSLLDFLRGVQNPKIEKI